MQKVFSRIVAPRIPNANMNYCLPRNDHLASNKVRRKQFYEVVLKI